MMRAATFVVLLVSAATAQGQTLAVKDSVGATVGFYAGPAVTTSSAGGWLRVVSSTGYSTVYNAFFGTMARDQVPQGPDAGRISSFVWHTTTDCSGQAYVTQNSQPSDLAQGDGPMPGVAFRAVSLDSDHSIWFVAKGAVLTPAASIPPLIRLRVSSLCEVLSPTGPLNYVYPVLPNDSGVTGFPDPPFTPPLTIEPIPVSAIFSIFRDGFESPQASLTRESQIGGRSPTSRIS